MIPAQAVVIVAECLYTVVGNKSDRTNSLAVDNLHCHCNTDPAGSIVGQQDTVVVVAAAAATDTDYYLRSHNYWPGSLLSPT